MKKVYIQMISLLFINLLNAQGGFTKLVDATNPITTFTAPGIYKGVSWIDYDNDNDLDLFAAPNFLFANNGVSGFTQIANPFGFTPLQNYGGSSWADLNNDGLLDCIIAQDPSNAYLNNGNGTFTNISAQIPNFNNYPTWGCAIGNWNNDAFPDFIFANPAGFLSQTAPCKLYLNTEATVTPQQITGYTMTEATNPYTVPYWSDYDLDGDMDLFLASGPGGSAGPDFCYKNMKIENGTNTFQQMTTELFTTTTQDGQCYNFIDYDNDQDLDLCLTNYGGAQTRFYVNTAGVYSLLVTPFTAQTNNLANNWGDFDNDGDLDVIISNDSARPRYYKNNSGIFAAAITLGTVNNSSGITNGDYDNDGDLDVFVSGVDATRALYRNTTAATGNNWINIKCTGTVSNKSALGTIVKIRATINGIDTWQMREINAQNSFQGQNDLRVHFGLGNATTIQSIIIKYPSGIIETFSNVSPNIFYASIENSGNLLSSNDIINPQNNFALYPNPSNESITIDFKSNLDNQKVMVSIIDTNGKVVRSKNQQIKNNSLKIEIAQIEKGIYFLILEGDNFKNYSKFIKE